MSARPRSRSRSSSTRSRSPASACRRSTRQDARAPAHNGHRLPGAGQGAVPRVPVPCRARGHADDHPVVPLQRHLLHLHPGVGQVLRRGVDGRPRVPHRLRSRQPCGPAHDRASLRHPRPQEDDRGHLRALRPPAGDHGVPVQRGRAQRPHADDRLVRHLLLRLGRGQRRLPDGQRDLPAGGAVEGHRGVLRHRPVLRRDRPGDLRRAHRRRLAADQAVLRLPARRRRS